MHTNIDYSEYRGFGLREDEIHTRYNTRKTSNTAGQYHFSTLDCWRFCPVCFWFLCNWWSVWSRQSEVSTAYWNQRRTPAGFATYCARNSFVETSTDYGASSELIECFCCQYITWACWQIISTSSTHLRAVFYWWNSWQDQTFWSEVETKPRRDVELFVPFKYTGFALYSAANCETFPH